MSEDQNSDLERKLQGRTLRVYLYLQKKKAPSGIREVQRELGLSSPSVADYQVEKLVEMGLATRDGYGRVYVTKHVRVKALQSYVSVGQFMVPRLAFYATFFTAVTASYLVLNPNVAAIYGAAIPATAAGIFWFEALKMWHIQLTDRKTKTKVLRDNRDFWVSLAPGMGALTVFIAAAFFLYYYIEPTRDEPPTFPVDASRMPPTEQSRPFSASELQQLDPRGMGFASDHAEIVAGFPVGLLQGFLFAGAAVAGFLVYLLVKYRTRQDVLALEQEESRQF
jgi:hypothetical protein